MSRFPAAAHTAASGGVHTADLFGWIESNVVGLVLLLIGVLIVMRAHKKNLSDAFTIAAIALIGLAVIGLAAGAWKPVGTWLSGMVFS